jgi:hypothetical protein
MQVEKSSFFAYFFSASAKKVRAEIILVFHFLASPQKTKQKNASAGKIELPTFSLLLKFPKLSAAADQTAENFNATSSCGFPV